MIARPEGLDDGDADRSPCVPFVPFRCPSCGRQKPFTYAVRGPMRYHRCQACNRKFRSWELGRDSVKGWEDGTPESIATRDP